MTLLARPLIVDDEFWGTVYTFEKVGDVLPVHRHDAYTNHISIVTLGRFKLLGDNEPTTLEAKSGGTIVNWKIGMLHGFEALTDGATLINIRKR